MLTDKHLKKLMDEIEVLVPYAVPDGELETARTFLTGFAEDFFALGIIKDYYQTLPDACEEALINIAVLEEREQVFLMLLSTTGHHYFYVTNDEESMFLGEWEKGMGDKQLLSFFGYPDNEAFAKAHSAVEKCRKYVSLERTNIELCPSCGVKTGEMHTVGCPVEVCPWCGGQLNRCNCRFEQMDVEEFTDEAMLNQFAEKLEQKGRISYAKEQRPTFMAEER